jgi:hypothetical protein
MRLLPAGRKSRLALALIVVVALGAAAAARWGAEFYRPAGADRLSEKLPPVEAPVSYPAKPGADPYPECPAIREWFATQVKEPGSVEIVSWEGRHVYKQDAGWLKAGQVMVTFKARDRNRYGGKFLNPWNVFLDKDGRPISGAPNY